MEKAREKKSLGRRSRNDYQREVHCNENIIYVFPEKELRGVSPNVNIHVSVSD